MSALLDDLRPFAQATDRSILQKDSISTTVTESRKSFPANSHSLPPPTRRKIYESPELDISTSVAKEKNSSASAVDSFKAHAAASQLLAEWHGQVVDIGAESFTAQLKGRFGEGIAGSEDEAVIPLDDVRDEDQELFRIGAFFSLCISYEVNAVGSKRRYTEVIFRRMPAFRREELDLAATRAKEIVRGFRLE
jgi:hypothetical protein